MRQYYFAVDEHEMQLWMFEQGRNTVNDSGKFIIPDADVIVDVVEMIIFYANDKLALCVSRYLTIMIHNR